MIAPFNNINCTLAIKDIAVNVLIIKRSVLLPHRLTNFGDILDETLLVLGIDETVLINSYKVAKKSIDEDREVYLTRRRLLKYRYFIRDYGVSENFFLRGIFPVLLEDVEKLVK